MNESEISFKVFNEHFTWDYMVNEDGADIIYTNKNTLETKKVSSYSLESAFEKVFMSIFV
jgi:hypothetical protein